MKCLLNNDEFTYPGDTAAVRFRSGTYQSQNAKLTVGKKCEAHPCMRASTAAGHLGDMYISTTVLSSQVSDLGT